MIYKPAYNEEYRIFDVSPQLETGETLISHQLLVCRVDNGVDATSELIITSEIVNDVQIRYKISGGDPGVEYSRRFLVTTSGGNKLDMYADNLKVT